MISTVLLGGVHSRGGIPQIVVPILYRENNRYLFPLVYQLSPTCQKRIFWTVKSSLSSQEKQLRALDSYFQKLHDSTGEEKVTRKNQALPSLEYFHGKGKNATTAS